MLRAASLLSAGLIVCGDCPAAPVAAPEPGEEVVTALVAAGVPVPVPVADRGTEGTGPFNRLIIKDVMIIDGTGAQPYGPTSITIDRDRIAAIGSDISAMPLKSTLHGADASIEVIDGRGLFVLPGFVDAHVHLDSTISARYGVLADPRYALKLWLGHGITTVRELGTFVGLERILDLKGRSAAGRITAPRIVVYPLFPQIEAVKTPQSARHWVRQVRNKGADGIKFILDSQQLNAWKIPIAGKVTELPLATHRAAVEEARALGIGVAVHHGATQPINPVDSAEMGVTSIEHDVGIEDDFGIPGALGYKSAQPRVKGKSNVRPDWARGDLPARWKQVIAAMISRDVTLVPTYAIMEARRNFTSVSRAAWHDEYTMPYLAKAFLPNPDIHGSSYLDWTTGDEIRWQGAFKASMRFLKDFQAAGGRIAAGSDAGFSYQLYGFAFIRELELLQEAGLNALDVIRVATQNGALLAGMSADLGTVEVGKKADLVLVETNPLENFKVLYGTGHVRYNAATGKSERVGGVKYTVRDGIVWDARALLADVRKMVADEKAKQSNASASDVLLGETLTNN